MKSKKKGKSKNLHLAFYFGFLVILIISVSAIFKSIDVIRKSKFDGTHRFTIAVIGQKSASIISVSPEEGSMTSLNLNNISNLTQFDLLELPVDTRISKEPDFSLSPKKYFPKMLLNKGSLTTDLTTIDLLRLSIYALGIDNEKIKKEQVSMKEPTKLSNLSSSLFTDQTILREKVSIQITNATDVSGLGNRLAKYITNMGGSVVLVNSSKDTKGSSEITYRQDSYTLKKLMKILDIPAQKKETNSISDIVIIIGKDKEDFK
ncbi:MAG: LytR C-terminal domain-containing protein [Candidatus Levybacteria bacterium]|nr:LytR C-terminal domain-containing protein [Candidatus Levybacteria bacterium]